VDDFAVYRRLADACLLLQYKNFAPARGERAGDREPNNSGADDNSFGLGNRTLVRLYLVSSFAAALRRL